MSQEEQPSQPIAPPGVPDDRVVTVGANGQNITTEEAMNLRKGCERGNGIACTMFGIYLGADESVKGKRVAKFLRKGCELGEPNGCYVLASWQLAGRVPGNERAAFQNCLTACKMRSVAACCQTGVMMFHGIGTKQNIPTGLSVLLQTCDQGKHGQSCFEAARRVMHLSDQGLLTEEEAATEQNVRTLLTKACDLDFQPGCELLKEFEQKFGASQPSDTSAASSAPAPPQASEDKE